MEVLDEHISDAQILSSATLNAMAVHVENTYYFGGVVHAPRTGLCTGGCI